MCIRDSLKLDGIEVINLFNKDGEQTLELTGDQGIVVSGKIQGTELEGTSLDINGSSDISGNLTLSGVMDILMVDNSGAAVEFKQGSDLYMRFITTNGGEHIEVNKNIELQGLTATAGSFSAALSTNTTVTADKGFTSHNQRGVSTNPHTTEEYPLGHYTGGKEIWSLDPTWSNAQLQDYFNSSNVAWEEDSTAPAGYSIKVTGLSLIHI